MPRRPSRAVHRSLTFRKVIAAPLPFVFQWCTDYREDDDRITDDLYHYRARILLREPRRVVRVVTVPGGDPLRTTEVEVIRLAPPDRWTVQMYSATGDRVRRYRLRRIGPHRSALEMRFVETWKVARIPSRARYRRLFQRVWDRYVDGIERDYRRR